MSLQLHEIQFTLTHLRSILNKVNARDDEYITETKEYMMKYFFSTEKGIYFFDGLTESFILTSAQTMRTNYLSKDLFAYAIKNESKQIGGKEKQTVTYQKKEKVFDAVDFLASTDFLERKFQVTINPKTEERVLSITKKHGRKIYTSMYLNMMPSYYHHYPDCKTYSDYDAKYKQGVQKLLDHLLEVWANNDQKVYDYIINWLACTICGVKLRTYLYLQSTERTGKSMPIEFIKINVLGERLTLMTSDIRTINDWSKPLEGRLLVNFNELPCSSIGQWRGTMDGLKSLVTESHFDVTDKCQKSYQQVNTFNIIITTNNDAIQITDTNKARSMALDVSESRLGHVAYFKNLEKTIMNDDVGEAFFVYMKEHYAVNGKSFNCDIRPETQSFKDKLTSNLPSYIDFIKFKFIREKENVDMLVDDFYKEYCDYCFDNNHRSFKKGVLGKKLSDLGFLRTRKTVDGAKPYFYFMEWTKLLTLFAKRQYIHDLDNIDVPDVEVNQPEKPKENNPLLIKLREAEHKINILMDRIKELENSKKLKDETVTIEEEEEDDEYEIIGEPLPSKVEVVKAKVVKPKVVKTKVSKAKAKADEQISQATLEEEEEDDEYEIIGEPKPTKPKVKAVKKVKKVPNTMINKLMKGKNATEIDWN